MEKTYLLAELRETTLTGQAQHYSHRTFYNTRWGGEEGVVKKEVERLIMGFIPTK